MNETKQESSVEENPVSQQSENNPGCPSDFPPIPAEMCSWFRQYIECKKKDRKFTSEQIAELEACCNKYCD